eukprot:TRINITY_DN2778_c0_g1_i9.p1 TRINITY_DN2778_c0_g1~~TRINITY_DN2778_c0_g1_i9.p1  ORF type:complete len:954 (-),score=122.26 TRINITY_DN2778_c0_g1_i9:172-2691(-)
MSRECSKSTKKSHTIRTFRKHCNLTEGEVRVIGPSGISYKDVGKGESNTGYMLASLMAIAHAQPKVIEDMFVDRHLWPKNVYKTKWFYHGREINVSVDNMIPAKKKYEPWFTQFSNSGEVWPMVVEKAWAKLHSSFGLVFGGYQLDFMSAVTQAPMEFVKHADHTTDLLWAKLVNGTRDGFAMTARVSKTEKSALSKDAVYAVLKSGMPGGKRSVLVANPNSPDTSKTAWMTLEEYHRKFGQTDMCQIHKNYELASIPFKPGKTAHQFKIQVLSAKSFWVSLAKPTGHQMSTYLSKEGCKREWYDFDTSFVAHRHVVERKSKPIAGWGIGHIVSAKVVAGTADDYWSVRASAMPKATAKEGSVVDNLYLTVYAPLGAMKLIGKGNLSTSSPPNPQASPTPSPTPTPTPSPAPTPAPSPSPPEEVKTVRVAITGYTAVAALAKPITCGSGQIVASKSVAHGTNSNCEARDMCKIEVDSDCRVRVYMYDRCRSVRSRYSWSAFSSTSATSGNCKAKVIKDKPEVRSAWKKEVVTLVNKWQPYGGSTYGGPFLSSSSGFCVAQGLIKGGNKGRLAIFPENCRPDKRLVFNLNGGDYFERADLFPDGALQWVVGTLKPGFISLSGIIVPKEPAAFLHSGYTNGYRAYDGPHGHVFGGFKYQKTDGWCIFQGLTRGTQMGHFATTPKECRYTGGVLVFNTNNNDYAQRVDLSPDGKLTRNAQAKVDHISLAGMVFPSDPSMRKNLPLANGWKNYDKGYAPAVYVLQNEICWLGGLIKDGAWGRLAILPEDCRPEYRLLFSTNNHVKAARVDVLPNGEVVWVEGGKDHGWVSLAGIFFKVRPKAR